MMQIIVRFLFIIIGFLFWVGRKVLLPGLVGVDRFTFTAFGW